jgi:glycosyltransferase involved in cell wall biosynthesis
MRIGIDGRYIQDQYHGVGRYTFETIRELAGNYPEHQLIVFFNPAYPNSRFNLEALKTYPNVTLVETRLRLFWPQQQLIWPGLLRRHMVDLFHTPFFDAPLLAPCPVVVTIHDLIFDRYPEYMPQRHFRLYYRLMMRLSLRRATRIIAVSEATRQDLVDLYGTSAEKICVTPEAASPEYRPVPESQAEKIRARYNLPSRFILTVGTRRPHKNVATLVKAFAKIAPETDAALVLAGKADARWPDDVAPLIRRLNLHGRIIQPGHIAEADMPALYTLADVFAFPSLVEGFGLPPLEAMACGTAVVAGNTSSLPEVVGEAGILVAPDDVTTLGRVLLVTLKFRGYRQKLERHSLSRAAHFTWQQTARLTMEAYQAVRDRQPILGHNEVLSAAPFQQELSQ